MTTAITILDNAYQELERVKRPDRDTALRLIEVSRRVMNAAHDFEAMRDVTNRVEAFKVYFQKSRVDRDACSLLALEWLRDCARMGEWLAVNVDHKGGRPRKLSPANDSFLPNGITLNQSMKLQRLAGIADELETFAADLDDVPSMAWALRLWDELNGHAIIPESTGDEWYTPAIYIDSVRAVMDRIDLDPASCLQANKTIGADVIYTKDDSGLDHDWPGKVFMNPPYSDNARFAERLFQQFNDGITIEAVALIGAHAIETKWFAPYWDHVLCFTGHRIAFNTPTGEQQAGNINGSVFVYLGDQESKFAKEFNQHGYVVKRWP